MHRILLPLFLAAAPSTLFAADDLKVAQLEQEVRYLQRELSRLSQEVETLRAQLSRMGVPAAQTPATRPQSTNSLWLDISRWQRVIPGMSELQVIELLGSPTSMRGEIAERELLYAMEIGGAGFLGGGVTLRNRIVVSVKIPVLQ
jgi:hypothetical protein